MSESVKFSCKKPKLPTDVKVVEKSLTYKEINNNPEAFGVLDDFFLSDLDAFDLLESADILEEDLYDDNDEFTNVLQKVDFYTFPVKKVKTMGTLQREITYIKWVPKAIYFKKSKAFIEEVTEEEKKFNYETKEEKFLNDFESSLKGLVKKLSDEYNVNEEEINALTKIYKQRQSPENLKRLLEASIAWREKNRKLRMSKKKIINPKTGKYYRHKTETDINRRKQEYAEIKQFNSEKAVTAEDEEQRIQRKIDKIEKDLRERVRKIAIKKATQEVNKKKNEIYALVEKKEKEILNRIAQQNKTKLRSTILKPVSKGSIKIDYAKYNDKLHTAIQSVKSDEYISPRSNMNVVDIGDLFITPEFDGLEFRKKTKGSEYKRTVYLTPAKIGKIYKFNRMYGCIAAATFFQLLVSNTPIDEDYEYTTVYKKKVKKNRAIIKYTEEGTSIKPKTPEQIATEIIGNEKIIYYTRTRLHEADSKKVRADWVLTFRGKNFKAWNTPQELYADSMSIDGYMDESWFETKADADSINNIAEYLLENTDPDNYDSSFEYNNLNPRWEILEKGGYKSSSEARIGSKYGLPHGTTNGFSYQAPVGFVRVIEALWNMLVDSGRWHGYITRFMNKNNTNLDVSDPNSELMQKLMRYDQNIGSSYFEYSEIEKKE